MCNDALRVAMRQKPSNRFSLIELAYPALKEYGLHTHYILAACEVAFAIYKNPRRKETPRITNPFIKLDNQSYQLSHLLLRIPTGPRRFIFLTLHGSDYHFSLIDDPSLKKGSIVITPRAINVSLSRKVETFEPVGFIGIDINETNVTASASDGWLHKFTQLAEIVDIKERSKDIRARIERKTGRDRRICRRLLQKYGERERNRTFQRIHRLTKQVVDKALDPKFGIKLERLTGIRRLFGKRTRQSRLFRGRMNTWVFGETQRQIGYKAKWEGIPVYYVNPRGTSSYCLCGSRVSPLADRKLYCPRCDKTWDRDDLASKNIMACAVPQARPSKGSEEGERGEDGSNPPSRWKEGESKVDCTKDSPEP